MSAVLSPTEVSLTVSRDVLLRCWLRETGLPVPGPGPLRVPLPGTGDALVVDVLRRSPTGAHDLGPVRTPGGADVGLEQLAALLTEEAAAAHGLPAGAAAQTARRVLDSARRAARYAEARAADPTPPPGLPAWLAAEQDLLAGHAFHPVAKSREGLLDAEDDVLAPELRGCFPLHWFGVRDELVRSGGGGVPAAVVAARAPRGFTAVPAHPWQAARLSERPAAAAMLAAGDLVELGPAGERWWATSSVRTVAQPGSPVMLKLSLGLRVTNSRRDNVRSELLLGERVAALVAAGLGRDLPAFGFVDDPAWVGVQGLVGLDTVVRDAPFGPHDRVACAGALLDARPDRGRPVVADLTDDGLAWFRAYAEVVALPLLRLHGSYGLGLEAHLQNLLVGLSPTGLPERAWYRDNQGWYVAASRAAVVEALLPGVTDGVPLVFDDDLVTDRVAYYLGVNALLGAVGAIAGAGLADEHDLLRELAGVLRAHLREPDPSPAAALLLEGEHLPAKANLLTTVDGRDELDGPVATQSVYVRVPNPLREVRR